jgi:hypothetical protein
MAEVTKGEELNDRINVQQLIDFLEYEEALTKDKETSQRIRILLKLLGVWN